MKRKNTLSEINTSVDLVFGIILALLSITVGLSSINGLSTVGILAWMTLFVFILIISFHSLLYENNNGLTYITKGFGLVLNFLVFYILILLLFPPT